MVRFSTTIASALALLPACYSGQSALDPDAGQTAGEGGSEGSTGGSSGDESGGPSGACDPLALDMRRLTESQYRRSIEAIFAGRVAASSEFPAPSGETQSGYSTELGARDVSEHDVEQIVYAAEDIGEGVAQVLGELVPCADEPAPAESCAGEFLDRYGRRAYRRTLTADERELLLDAWAMGIADGATFAESVALMVDVMMQAPQFLYVNEYAAPTVRALEGFEIASRLSFMLWDSTPDDELLDLAENGGLADEQAILDQAERMLESPSADTTMARFFREWTRTKRISEADKSVDAFPMFDGSLAESMNESFDRFTLGTLRDGGTLQDMLRATDAWVDASVAPLVGVDPPADGQWTSVALDPTRYRGVLTQPALLASLAHSDRTSYVFRGHFVRTRLLCEDLPPPPAAAMGVELDLPPDPTARQESEARIARPDCGGCHALLDPAGLAFEPFDALGRYSATDASGRTIDPAGTLLGFGGDIEFSDHVELIDQLAELPEIRSCFARQLFRFAMSRMETADDECTIAELEAVLDETDGDLGAALLAIVGVEAFRAREAP